MSENSATTCADSVDNDEDDQIDCADPDCAQLAFCASEATAAACADGEDNDEDDQIDCADPDCAGFFFCAAGEADPVSCRNGSDDDEDGQVDCADAGCAGFCAAVEVDHVQCADGVDNDGDGVTDCADAACAELAYCTGANGYPRIDPWRDVWDGWPRLAATLDVAWRTCETAGGRLPTAAELYRNSGVAGVGARTFPENDWMWTRLTDGAGNPVAIHIGTGQADPPDLAAERIYRCIWPEETTPGFDRRRCLGPPGGECFPYGRENADAYERPAIDYVAASQECSFEGASLPVVADWGELTHGGIPFTTKNWLWNGNPTYGDDVGYVMTVSSFDPTSAPHWGFSSSYSNGSYTYTDSRYRFRCVGLADSSTAELPADPSCQGGCFEVSSRRSPLLADSQDRTPASWDVAVETCRTEGGELPNQADVAELAHAGWAGSGTPLWMAHGNSWGGAYYGSMAALVSPAPTWRFNGTVGALVLPPTTYAYRCVWRSRSAPLPTCAAGDVIVAEGDALGCVASVNGDSNGSANPGGTQILDRFGNAWDTLQRDAATYSAARAACEGVGGRLPTASEIWGARVGEPYGPPIGDGNSVSYLWTTTHSFDKGTQIVARISDGGAAQEGVWVPMSYRCIWPSSRGAVLSGRGCYGPPGAGCFAVGADRIADQMDRIALPVPAAIEECRASGGTLPDLRDFSVLTHSGWPNGSGSWLLVNEGTYTFRDDPFNGYLLARWVGTATIDWTYGKPSDDKNWGDVTRYHSFYPFRCVYSTLNR